MVWRGVLVREIVGVCRKDVKSGVAVVVVMVVVVMMRWEERRRRKEQIVAGSG